MAFRRLPILIQLTHYQLATAVGTTRVTITRLLKDLKDQGWLRFDQRYLVLQVDPGGLPRQ